MLGCYLCIHDEMQAFNLERLLANIANIDMSCGVHMMVW